MVNCVECKCSPDEPRVCDFEPKTLTQIRKDVEKHIKNYHFKKLQAPIGVKPTLKAWMELN